MNDIASLYNKVGFIEPPFSQSPDTSFLFKSKQHVAALDHLKYGLITDGFTLLTGNYGVGKTLLCRQLLKTASKDIKTVYIYNTYLSMLDILKVIYYDLTGNQLEGESSSKCFHEINQLLLSLAEEGKKVVILIDEAQGLKPDVLEGLRQLSNLETEKRKLLSFIIVGQRELEARLAKSDLRQLEQRINVRYILKPFSLPVTREYIDHRLGLATNKAANNTYHFTKRATYLVHKYSRGIPRRINQICDRALMASFNAGKTKIGSRIIHRSAREILSGNSVKEGKSFSYNTLVKVTIILTILGLVIYIVLGLYQDKMKENRSSTDFVQNNFVIEPPPLAETSRTPTAVESRIQFPIGEKQTSEVPDTKPEIGEDVDKNALDSYRQKPANSGDIEEAY